jgi:Fe-S cluster assembly protein SufD
MSTTTQNLSTDHSRATADEAHSHGVGVIPEASRAARATSFDVTDFPVPTGREEEWRFSPVDRLAPLFAGATAGVLSGHGVLTTVVNAPEEAKKEGRGRKRRTEY